MQRSVVACIALLALCLPAAAQQPGPGILRGTVTDNLGRVPVSYAAVRLLREDSTTVALALTDDRGWFNLSVANGSYRLRVEHFSYEPLPDTDIRIERGDTLVLAVRINPLPVLLDQIIVAGRSEQRLRASEQLIHGRLVDDDSRAVIPGATIHLLREDGTAITKTITSEHGLFRIVTPTPGTYVLRAERIGYKTADSPKLRMMLGDTMRLDFFLSTRVVLLGPILVQTSARPIRDRYSLTGMDAFFSRMREWEHRAKFVTRAMIDDYDRQGYTTMRVIDDVSPRGRRDCTSLFWWEGSPFRLPNPEPPRTLLDEINDLFFLSSLEAIEVYTAPAIPPRSRPAAIASPAGSSSSGTPALPSADAPRLANAWQPGWRGAGGSYNV